MSAKQYFQNGRFDNIKDKDQIILNKYYLIFPKELDGSLFLNNYIEYTKIKTQTEFKNKLKLVFLNNLLQYEQALEAAELINLDNPILLKSMPHQQSAILNEPEALFYNGTKILKQQIINKKKLILNLEADKFNYNPILDKASAPETMVKNQFLKTLAGLIFGLFLSLVIIFFRNILEKE